MERYELIEKLASIDEYIWSKPSTGAEMRNWDDYSEELLEHCTTWDGLDSDTLWMAYNHGVNIVSSIDPEYAGQNL